MKKYIMFLFALLFLTQVSAQDSLSSGFYSKWSTGGIRLLSNLFQANGEVNIGARFAYERQFGEKSAFMARVNY